MSAAPDSGRLRHGRGEIALHRLRGADGPQTGPPLLLLHALGRSAVDWRDAVPTWPGPVHALDFAGHGASDPLRGGGYAPEFFVAHADLALARLGGRAAVAGRGLGAYVALLLAGARPASVPAALLLPGAGLAGAGSMPDFDRPAVESLEEWEAHLDADAAAYAPGTDPMVALCARDHRPDDYGAAFAAAARRLLFVPPAPGEPAPPSWWRAARRAAAGAVAIGEETDPFARLAEACR